MRAALTAAPTDIHRVPHDPLATTQDNRFRYSLDTTLGLAQGSLMADQTPYIPHRQREGERRQAPADMRCRAVAKQKLVVLCIFVIVLNQNVCFCFRGSLDCAPRKQKQTF